ncbi:MAG: alpha-ketoacid dehydrogenase subunit beta [Chloroflexota bacterium]
MPDLTYREALRQALREEMLRDERVFIMGEDVAAYGGTYAVTKGLVDEFGEKRVRDTPIAEAVIVGASVGAAMAGLRPVAELMTVNFSLLALDQIVNHAAKIHFMFGGQATAPMVIRTASGWGQLGPTHSQTFDSYFAYVPGLIVVAPSTPRDAKGLMKAAIRDPNPVVFLEHSLLYSMRGEVPDGDDHVEELGKSRVLRAGRDVTIVSYSRMAMVSLRAAEQLAKEGIEAEIIDLRCLRPMDMEPVLESVRRTNRAVVAEEGWRSCGMGAEISSRIHEKAFDYLDAPVKRVAAPEVPVAYNRKLERQAIPHEEDVVQAVRELMK